MQRYAISGGSLSNAEGAGAEHLIAHCGELAQAGVDFILLREKTLTARDLVVLTRRAVSAVGESCTKVIVPGRADIALAAAAHGVHLSADPGELTPKQARFAFPRAWVSVSCHSAAEVLAAKEAGVDGILFAPVFGKTAQGLEVVRGVGLEALREACALAGEVPVFALGGVNERNAQECVAAGAAGVAGIRMFFGLDLGRGTHDRPTCNMTPTRLAEAEVSGPSAEDSA